MTKTLEDALGELRAAFVLYQRADADDDAALARHERRFLAAAAAVAGASSVEVSA